MVPVSYGDDTHPYTDLVVGRVDAVLWTTSCGTSPEEGRGFVIQPGSVATGHYVGLLAPAETALRDRINDLLLAAMRDGSLERILRSWNIWNDDQPELHQRLLAGGTVAPTIGDASNNVVAMSRLQAARLYLPSLLRASLVTLVLSCLSMGLAVAFGVLIATGRVCGSRLVRGALIGYVELIRA